VPSQEHGIPNRAEFHALVRPRSPLALAGVLIILLLAVVGFAAFSPPPVETSATTEGVVLPPTASGSVAGSVLASRLTRSVAPVDVPPTTAAVTRWGNGAVPLAETAPADTTLATTTTAPAPTTTAAPTTTTAAPTTTTTPTTTTAAPTTTTSTTTTLPPTTTTTAVPTTTTTAPPQAEPPPAGVEQWRGLVEAHWPAAIVDDALWVIDCESGGDPNAYNPASGASGLFQFVPSTWLSASEEAGWGGADVFDPEPNIAVAAWLYAAYETPWASWSCKP
jgi:hypothetical protein